MININPVKEKEALVWFVFYLFIYLFQISEKLANIRQGSDNSLYSDQESENQAGSVHSSMRFPTGTIYERND